jgi:hypothetical protein
MPVDAPVTNTDFIPARLPVKLEFAFSRGIGG